MKQNSISNLGPIDVPFCGMKQQPMESDRTTVFNSPGLVSRDLPAAAPHSFVLSGFPEHISAVFDAICLGRRVKEQVKRGWTFLSSNLF
jgi:hypothetical protein